MKFVKVTDNKRQEKIHPIEKISLEKEIFTSGDGFWYYVHFTPTHSGSGNEYIKFSVDEAEYTRLTNVLLNEKDGQELGQELGQIKESIKSGIKEAVNDIKHPLAEMEVE